MMDKVMRSVLKNHKCKDCKHIDFYDWYYCTLDLHSDKNGFLLEKPKKDCEKYKTPEWDEFW